MKEKCKDFYVKCGSTCQRTVKVIILGAKEDLEIKIIILFVKVTNCKAWECSEQPPLYSLSPIDFDTLVNGNDGVFVLEDMNEGVCVYLEEEQEDNSIAMCNRERRTLDRLEESDMSRGRNYQNRF